MRKPAGSAKFGESAKLLFAAKARRRGAGPRESTKGPIEWEGTRARWHQATCQFFELRECLPLLNIASVLEVVRLCLEGLFTTCS
jgi:hypothetical protein